MKSCLVTCFRNLRHPGYLGNSAMCINAGAPCTLVSELPPLKSSLARAARQHLSFQISLNCLLTICLIALPLRPYYQPHD